MKPHTLRSYSHRVFVTALICITPLIAAAVAPSAAHAQAGPVSSRPGSFTITAAETDLTVYAGETVSTDITVSSPDGDLSNLAMTASVFQPYAGAFVESLGTGGDYRVTITTADAAPGSKGEVYLNIPGVLVSSRPSIALHILRRVPFPSIVIPNPTVKMYASDGGGTPFTSGDFSIPVTISNLEPSASVSFNMDGPPLPTVIGREGLTWKGASGEGNERTLDFRIDGVPVGTYAINVEAVIGETRQTLHLTLNVVRPNYSLQQPGFVRDWYVYPGQTIEIPVTVTHYGEDDFEVPFYLSFASGALGPIESLSLSTPRSRVGTTVMVTIKPDATGNGEFSVNGAHLSYHGWADYYVHVLKPVFSLPQPTLMITTDSRTTGANGSSYSIPIEFNNGEKFASYGEPRFINKHVPTGVIIPNVTGSGSSYSFNFAADNLQAGTYPISFDVVTGPVTQHLEATLVVEKPFYVAPIPRFRPRPIIPIRP
jgi:hypothetical protein